MKKMFIALAVLFTMSTACKQEQKEQATESGLLPSKFSAVIDDRPNALYTLKNKNGMEACIINVGGRVVSLMVPDKNGTMQDVVLGFDNLQDYKQNRTDFGAIIGRYANRISGGKFELNYVTYRLPQNDGKNTLHGGPRGFQYQWFDIEQIDSTKLTCSHLSKQLEEGFPGDLKVTVTYTLTDDNALDISYSAETNFPNHVNLTNHSYFNLSGNPANTILDHVAYIDADKYTPTNDELIPTGKIESLKKTPLDFTTPAAIGARIDDSSFVAIKYGRGYDHNYVLNKPGNEENLACKVVCPATGIGLEVYTNEPGVQLYTGNFLDGTLTGKKGIVYERRTAFCLETQHFPDTPNRPEFPSTVLKKDEIYYSRCIYKFTVE